MRLILRRPRNALCAVLAAAAGSGPVAAAPPPEPTPRPLVTSVEVSVTSIDVVVTDSKGNRVRDLKREDFEVREDGKVQPLSNFLFVDDTAPAPPEEVPGPGDVPSRPQPGVLTPAVSRPQARIAAFIDNLHLPPWNRNAVLAALDGFLRKAVGPNVEAMVVSYDRALRIRGAFTRDAEVLSRVLSQISNESTPGAGRL
ncbi:MAG TPA: VWA domain-containing protein, partial [Thermoanaerobaculia bacterium]|nr:VWA domain-containing protein [Thermoanaerobaculia bacterium]